MKTHKKKAVPFTTIINSLLVALLLLSTFSVASAQDDDPSFEGDISIFAFLPVVMGSPDADRDIEQMIEQLNVVAVDEEIIDVEPTEDELVALGRCWRSTLRYGNRGSSVKFAQNQLLRVGGRVGRYIRESGGADGAFGRGTLRAVVAYQQLVFPGQPREHDGIVGSKTWGKLGCSSSDRPAGAPPVDDGNPPPIVSNLAQKAKAKAEAEYAAWNNGRYTERESRVTSRMKNYWKAVGWNPSTSQIQSSSWQSRSPWSAAFTSWVMKEAGAGSQFNYSAAHAAYIVGAKNNTGNQSKQFWGYQGQAVKPQVGDLVCFSRQSGVNFNNIRIGHKTHCDLVTEAASAHVIVIGGNTSDGFGGKSAHTVGKKRVNLSGQRLPGKYFAIVRIRR